MTALHTTRHAGLLAGPRRRRGVALALLAGVVLLVHLWLGAEVLESQLGDGKAPDTPRRIDVAFVRELAQTQPPPAAPAPPRRRAQRPAVAAAPEPAPSAPEPAPVQPAPDTAAAVAVAAAVDAEPAASAPEPAASQALAAAAAASSASAAAATAFEWPPSTRLSYTLTGNYRGPVDGQAQVEWLRDGGRYQVHLDVSVGPAFAPLLARRLSSDGEITEAGLLPQRYDEETRAIFKSPRLLTVRLDGSTVQLANGKTAPQPAGVQDSASQFVQLTWLFTTRPELLTPGRSIAIPLALPRRLDTWTYDVLQRETLNTPAGAVDTVHVKPRREPRPGVELTAEMWVAPSLQYLPVRIVIRQDADTWVDLLIARLPQQAQR